jgi:hypothetical protein
MMGATISSPYKGEVGSQCEPGGGRHRDPSPNRRGRFDPPLSGEGIRANRVRP